MEFITEAVGMEEFSNQHFRLCVLAFDPAHVVAAYFFGVDVCHGAKVNALFTFFVDKKSINLLVYCCPSCPRSDLRC